MSPSALPSIPLLSGCSLLCLFILLGAAVYFDLRFRRIPNGLSLMAAVAAVPYWIGVSGHAMPASIGQQFLILLIAAAPLLLLFAVGALGGGDIKLLGAVLLWIPAGDVLEMVATIILAGGVVAVGAVAHALWRRRNWSDATVPFGVAIAAGAMPALAGDFVVALKALGALG